MSTEAPPAPAAAPAQLEPTPAAPAAATPPAAAQAVPAIIDNRPPVAEPPPPAAPAIGPDGKLGENWFLALGDEFAPHAKDLGKHKDIRSVLTELEYFRKNGVEYPGAAADAKAIERFRKVAGVPETPEGYGLTAENAKLPEGMVFDTELAAEVSKAAHETHTPPAALAKITAAFNEVLANRTAEAAKQAQEQAKATQDALVKEWGGDFLNNASTVRHITSKIAESAGIMPDDPAMVEFLADINAKPALAKMMLQVSRLTSEDRIQTPTGFGDLQSPAQRIAAIKAGTDPVWGAKWKSGTTAEKQEAYEFVKQLSERAKQ